MENQELQIQNQSELLTVKAQMLSVSLQFKDFKPMPVSDAGERDLCMSKLADIKATIKAVEAKEKEVTKPIKGYLDEIKSWFKQAKEALELAERSSKQLVLAYDAEQDRIRREAQRLQQEIENKAAEARRLALEEAAIDLEFQGKKEEAVVMAAQAEIVQPAKIAEVVVKQEGSRKIWKYEIVDRNLIPRSFMQPNESMIGSIVRSDGANVSIPGVRVYFETILAVKT